MNGTVTIAQAGPSPYTSPMTATLIGYARCSTDRQDLAAQRQALLELGVAEGRIYTDHGLTGTTRARPGLDQALAAVRAGDTLVVPKLDRLARSVPDARAIADQLQERGVKLALGRALYDPGDPMGKMFFNILATFAEFEADLIRMRTREGMAIARAKGKLRGKQPKLSDRQQRELCRMHATGEYSISDLAELFSVSRPTVYRTLNRRHSPWRTILPPTGIDPKASASMPSSADGICDMLTSFLDLVRPIPTHCRHFARASGTSRASANDRARHLSGIVPLLTSLGRPETPPRRR